MNAAAFLVETQCKKEGNYSFVPSQEGAWELVTFLLLLLAYERRVAVLRRYCYVSFATVNVVVHLFAYGGNDSGGNDSTKGEAQ